ncbi:MAG: hypothetical protein ACTSSI_08455 [Candidatus Helarchaeota archaeon]
MKRKISKKDLHWRLMCIRELDSVEEKHIKADESIIRFVGDEEIAIAYNKIEKWYA